MLCRGFKIGMGCMDDFGKRCLSYQERQTMEAHVAGARHTFKFLCDDPVFQTGNVTCVVHCENIEHAT